MDIPLNFRQDRTPQFSIEKANGYQQCSYHDCHSLPEYTHRILNGADPLIKRDTICARMVIWCGGEQYTRYYCRDCIPRLYEDMKKVLDPNLWIFK